MVTKPRETRRPETVLQGIGVSPGVAIGSVFLLTADEDHVVERKIEPAEAAREIMRFEHALIETRRQIKSIQSNIGEAIGKEDASILDAHLMVLDDRAFVEDVIRGIETDLDNAEAALRVSARKYAEALAGVKDDFLRERVADVKDVARRVMGNLSGRQGSPLGQLDHACVVVANDLAPSETATLNREFVLGFATDLGSPTSHTAVMARALEIPAVVGLHDVTQRVVPGDRVLLDGNKGVLIVNPTRARLDRYGRVLKARQSIQIGLTTLKDKPAETTDGRRVLLSANIDSLDELEAVELHGAEGVGLFRSEYLFLSRPDRLPDEDEQADVYGQLAQRMAPGPVIIRTLDLGGDKFLSHVRLPPEMNPFMGCRAIRLCLARPEMFKAQLRAILRAGGRGRVKVMYPMVTKADEVRQANDLLAEARQELTRDGVEYGADVEVGVMIETPSAALTVDTIAPHVAFFSLGTNDLIQYTLAVDRVNERVAYLYEPTHPAILKLIKNTIDVGHACGLWVGLCGEMAGDPVMTPLLLGLGLDEFSMSPAAVPLVKDMVRGVSREQARALAESALSARSGSEVLSQCRELTRQVAPEILELLA